MEYIPQARVAVDSVDMTRTVIAAIAITMVRIMTVIMMITMPNATLHSLSVGALDLWRDGAGRLGSQATRTMCSEISAGPRSSAAWRASLARWAPTDKVYRVGFYLDTIMIVS